MIFRSRRRRDALKNVHAERDTFTGRAVAAVLFCITCIVLLIMRLVDLQVVEHDYFSTRADENRMRVTPVAPVRGLIYDRNGTVLAQNQPAFVLEITPEQIKDMDALLKRLARVVTIGDADIERFKDRARKTPRYRGVPLRTNLSMEEVARYEIRRHEFPGVEVTAGLSRNYPLAASAAHVVGYVGGITEAELQKVDERAYQGLNQIGKVGVEKSQEDELRGSPGAKIIEANAYGRPLRELDYRRGYPGRNAYLSLDAKVQLVAEEALGELNGAVVALDPRNGEVIALVSKPGYDPHYFVEGISTKDYNALLNDPSRPLFNRALQGTYPPGSTVKPAMALSGLEFGAVDPQHREFCRGQMSLPGSSRKYRCWKRSGHGWVDMHTAVMRSCDVYFYQLALSLGIDRMHEAMTGFGFGHLTGIDLPLEKAGIYPSREWKQKTRRENWYPGETLSVGIGQGYTSVTPLQLAQMTARIAMRGLGFVPHVLHSTEDPISKDIRTIEPQPLPKIALKNEADWETVIAAMQDVVHTQAGTAYRIGRTAPYRIAAKTGTAQVVGLKQDEAAPKEHEIPLRFRDHALFIAFAPAEAPTIAVAVIAEHGSHGGSTAGPVARKVMDQYLLGKVLYDEPPPAPVPAPVPTARPRAPVSPTEESPE
jgi:penicillin-binding protein 2